MANIIIPDRDFRMGKTRSEHAYILKQEGWGNAGMTDEQLDKAKFLEKHQGKRFFRATDIDNVR